MASNSANGGDRRETTMETGLRRTRPDGDANPRGDGLVKGANGFVNFALKANHLSQKEPRPEARRVKKKRRRRRRLESETAPEDVGFKMTCSVTQDNKKHLYGVQFNPHLQAGGHLVFAAVGGVRVSIYECTPLRGPGGGPTGEPGLKSVRALVDDDPHEDFYCCAWSYDDEASPLLVAGGCRGIIKVISPAAGVYVKQIVGHTAAVNELKFHPLNPHLLISASKDHTLKLWNIKTSCCIAVFGGPEGHRDQVLTADFHMKGHRLISGGMDHSLKIWSLDSEIMVETIESSFNYDSLDKEQPPFRSAQYQCPIYTTRKVHSNYVDSVRWFGNFVLSKSCQNEIVCWKPGKIDTEEDIFLPEEGRGEQPATFAFAFALLESKYWFMKFSMDKTQNTMALGNRVGQTYVWDISVDDPETSEPMILSHPNCVAALRETALSADGSVLICVGEDSSIWRWDRFGSSR